MIFKVKLFQAWYNCKCSSYRETIGSGFIVPSIYWFELKRIGVGLFDFVAIQKPSSARKRIGFDAGLINTQLARASLIVTQGSISVVDAMVIEAKQTRQKKNQER